MATSNGTVTVLHHFTGGSDGDKPLGDLVQGGDGGFYGATSEGGNHNKGTVFGITTNGVLTVLYSFAAADIGGNASIELVEGVDGSLYGTTSGSTGRRPPPFFKDTVFKLATNGTFTTQYSFRENRDGASPRGLTWVTMVIFMV